VVASEAEAGRQLAESLIKQVTGGEPIVARQLHREPIEYTPQFKLFFGTNHKPGVRGTDHAIWRRIRLVPFTVTIPPEEQDRELGAKLAAEAPGILRWMVEGALSWQREGGLAVPKAVLDATENYREEMDVLSEFLSEHTERSPKARVKASDLYDVYTRACEAAGERPMSRKKLGFALEEHGYTAQKSGSTRYWRGLRLRSEDDR
jgi:putative DNA primase/helicase